MTTYWFTACSRRVFLLPSRLQTFQSGRELPGNHSCMDLRVRALSDRVWMALRYVSLCGIETAAWKSTAAMLQPEDSCLSLPKPGQTRYRRSRQQSAGCARAKPWSRQLGVTHRAKTKSLGSGSWLDSPQPPTHLSLFVWTTVVLRYYVSSSRGRTVLKLGLALAVQPRHQVNIANHIGGTPALWRFGRQATVERDRTGKCQLSVTISSPDEFNSGR